MYEPKRAHPLRNVPLTISNAPCAVAAQGALPVYGEKKLYGEKKRRIKNERNRLVSYRVLRCSRCSGFHPDGAHDEVCGFLPLTHQVRDKAVEHFRETLDHDLYTGWATRWAYSSSSKRKLQLPAVMTRVRGSLASISSGA